MDILWILLDAYIIFIVMLFILSVVLKNKKIFIYSLFCGVVLAIAILVEKAPDGRLKMAKWLFTSDNGNGVNLRLYLPFLFIVLIGKEMRFELDNIRPQEIGTIRTISSSQSSKGAIIDAVYYLAERKIGAIITIEKHNSLDQYAEKAIQMNSDISKELLINIFEPNTPLHDGAVIIRGDKIRCAGAYYVLTQSESSDKTMGSRHRAALGISEVSDALTIVCSEETGHISITTEGIMLRVADREKLVEYIDMFLK